MTADLSKFAGAISKLKYEHDAPDLSEKISLYAPEAKQSDKFLIKMEIRRLAQPVNRVIDLRNYIKEGCESVERGGINHYLDPLALADFDQEYSKFKNTYCLAIFDFVVERAKNRDQDAVREAALPDPRFISLTRVHQRRDVRIYYSSEVHLFNSVDAGSDLQTPDFLAKTTDLSERGLSLKLSDPTVQLPHDLVVKFSGLEQEFLLSESLFVKYNLLRQISKEGSAYAVLTLDEEQDSAVLKALTELLKVCIHNQKRRNRVPVENTVDSVESKIREQYIIGRLSVLPLLLEDCGDKFAPRVFLKSADNEALNSFLTASGKGSLLPSLFGHPLIRKQVSPSSSTSFFLLRFRDKNKNLCFALIPLDEALENKALKQLLTRAFEQGGVRLINLFCAPVDALSGAYVPTSLPDSVGEVFENLNREPHPKLRETLSDISHLGVLNDISDSADVLRIKAELNDVNAGNEDPLSMRQYLLNSVDSQGTELLSCEVECTEARKEDRFKLRMPLRIIGRKRDNKDKEFKASSTDVSTRGMHVVVDGGHPFAEGNEVFVDMRVQIGKIDKVIKGQRYRIVKVQGPELWLAVTGDLSSHEARIVLRKVIYRNLDTLLAVGSNDPIYGLSRAVRNVYASYHPMLYGLVRKDQHGTLLRSIVRSENHLPLRFHDMLAEPIGLKMLVKNKVFRKALESASQSLSEKAQQCTFHLCAVARSKRQSSDISLVVKPLDRSDDDQDSQFIYNSLKSFGNPVVLRLSLTLKAPVFDKYFRDEMRYLLRYSKIKHKECIEIQESATSILEIEDVSSIFRQ